MTESRRDDWARACRDEGLDPAELHLVLERYRAYCRYHQTNGNSAPSPIETWFTWYRMETASEAGQQAPSPSGCSVDGDARNRGAIRKPAAFLRLLAQLAAIELVA